MTTIRIGGIADTVVTPLTLPALRRTLHCLQKKGIPYAVVGNGSNLLCEDRGFHGVIVSTVALRLWRLQGERLVALCGTPLPVLARVARSVGLSGLEFAAGIPATLGGATYMNAGAFGGAISDVLWESICYDPQQNRVIRLPREAHGFAYRQSCYRKKDRILLCATLHLKRMDPERIAAKMAEYQAYRRATQPQLPSAGSVFRRSEGVIPAQLLDGAGCKGLRVGDACVSSQHAGFIVNCGNATANDVQTLIERCRARVRERYQTELHCEVELLRDPRPRP